MAHGRIHNLSFMYVYVMVCVNSQIRYLLYLISMSLIAFNLTRCRIASVKVSDRPDQIGVYAGGVGDISGGRHGLLDLIYRISSFTSFIGIWLSSNINDRLQRKYSVS